MLPRRITVPVVVGLMAFALPRVDAQLSELQPGARVRVMAPGIVAGRFTGTMLSRTADTLVVGSPNAAPVKVPLDRITAVEVSRGSSRAAGAKRGLMWGIPLGLLAGLISDNQSHDAQATACSAGGGCVTSHVDGNFVLAGIVAGAAWGAGIGALIGRERWERFDISPHSAFDYRDGRMRFGIPVSF